MSKPRMPRRPTVDSAMHELLQVNLDYIIAVAHYRARRASDLRQFLYTLHSHLPTPTPDSNQDVMAKVHSYSRIEYNVFLTGFTLDEAVTLTNEYDREFERVGVASTWDKKEGYDGCVLLTAQFDLDSHAVEVCVVVKEDPSCVLEMVEEEVRRKEVKWIRRCKDAEAGDAQ